MNIEEFYDADERRRGSAELQFGDDWHDEDGHRYELNWVEETGELYVMHDEPTPIWFDGFGDFVAIRPKPDDLGVRVLKVVEGRDNVLRLLEGWQDAMAEQNSVAWLIDRLQDSPA